MLTILLQRDIVTAPFLAEKFEVSRRTINRDIEDLCKAGIPIISRQGYGGGLSIAEGYKIDKALFTKSELEAIFTGLRSIDSISETSHFAKLSDKLFPNAEDAVNIGDYMVIDLGSFYKEELKEKIEILRKAIENKVAVKFDYYSEKGKTRRIIEPHLIAFKWSAWYLYGLFTVKDELRLFKLNRISDLTLTDYEVKEKAIYKTSEEFDAYFTEEIELVALFDISVKYRIVYEYGLDSFKLHHDGRLLFERHFTNEDYLLT